MALFGEPGHKPLDEILSADENPSSDDQRERPRFGPVEQIANIAYEALRKHKDALPEPPEELQKTGT
jgi:hypothetical protein